MCQIVCDLEALKNEAAYAEWGCCRRKKKMFKKFHRSLNNKKIRLFISQTTTPPPPPPPAPIKCNADNELEKNSHFMLGKYGIYYYLQCVCRMDSIIKWVFKNLFATQR